MTEFYSIYTTVSLKNPTPLSCLYFMLLKSYFFVQHNAMEFNIEKEINKYVESLYK